jgi:erythromycin esterase-like protein
MHAQGNVTLSCRYGEEAVYIVGQMAYAGEVAAAPEWNTPVQTMQLRPAAEGGSCGPAAHPCHSTVIADGHMAQHASWLHLLGGNLSTSVTV